MKKEFRSSCMIASALDLIGDKWSLLIVRDMLLYKKKTFKELMESDEAMASNLLSGRLKLLESIDLITKQKLPGNKKENIYLLTPMGLDLAPIIMELVLWSDKYVREYNPAMYEHDSKVDKSTMILDTQTSYREFVEELVS